MMLSEEELRYIAKDVLDTCKDNECEPTKCPDFGFNISCRDYRNLLDTISAKDKQIQDMQERLDKVNKNVSYIISQYETDFTEFELTHDFLCQRERVVLEFAREALETIERSEK